MDTAVTQRVNIPIVQQRLHNSGVTTTGASTIVWGSITGNINDQADLQSALKSIPIYDDTEIQADLAAIKTKLDILPESYILVITNNIIEADAAQKVLDTYNKGGEIYIKYASAEQLYKPVKMEIVDTAITMYVSNYNESIGNNYTVITITIGQTAIETYGKKIVNIVNNLTSTSTGFALAANQGKILNDKIVAVTEDLSNYATKQYVDNAIATIVNTVNLKWTEAY